MMRILILGGGGMLGRQLTEALAPHHEIAATFRNSPMPAEVLDRVRLIGGVDALRWKELELLIHSERPEVVINAIGLAKQRASRDDMLLNIELNALLPHRLTGVCREIGARLVHFSTDCVFSGDRGNYKETDIADARDIYGRTKLLGEIRGLGIFTLRTSFIGLEQRHKASLIEWFLAQTGEIKGFEKAIYSGFTTLEMSRIVQRVLAAPVEWGDVYQVSSDPITKHDLLCRLRSLLKRDIVIKRDVELSCDRSLLSTRFRQRFEYRPPTWDWMLSELAEQILMRERDEKS